MSIKFKMVAISVLVLVAIGCLSVISLVEMNSFKHSYNEIMRLEVDGKIDVLEINRDVNYVSRLSRNIMLGSNIQKDLGKFRKMQDRITDNYASLKARAVDSNERDMLSKAEKATMQFVNQGYEFSQNLQNVDVSGRYSHYSIYSKSATPLAVKSREHFGALVKAKEEALIESKKQMDSNIASTVTLIMIVSTITIILILLLIFQIGRSVLKSIGQVVNVVETMADNDLTCEIAKGGNDETGTMLNATQRMLDTLKQTLSTIIKGIKTLGGESDRLTAISNEMSTGAQNISSKTSTVAIAAEEMGTNMSSIAAAAEESTINIQIVATAAEEMTATIGDVVTNTEKTKATSAETVSRTNKAAEQIDKLSDSAQEIGKMIETINDISAQTNLLALNATIEAARAGEAGKGFAVVANEIKGLAEQTAGATTEIKSNVESIQRFTQDTVTEIKGINVAISGVNEMIDNVASAVEQQASATREVAENVSQAAHGIHEVTQNVSQSSIVANDIARDISDVNASIEAISNSCKEVDSAASNLDDLSAHLDNSIKIFKI